MKTLADYQKSVERVMGSDRNERAVYALRLAGEAGEVVDLLKKHWGHNKPLDRDSLRLELGDVLWYVTALARQFGFTLEEVADANDQKLQARYPDGFDHNYKPNPPVPAYVPPSSRPWRIGRPACSHKITAGGQCMQRGAEL